MNYRILLYLLVFLLPVFSASSQGFLRAQNKEIVDGSGNPFILRGMGLGGWMLQEGYMLQTAGFANAQHQIRERIELLIGKEATDEFYQAWLANHVTKADIDSLKSWGFNSVRLPMHYNLFTLPIEDEPVRGEHTWLEQGFELTDQLIEWCKANEMYVILDLHAAPGGQGYDEGISDYDTDKPSLWESELNFEKTVALWGKLAERYADEPWVGGYDLLNEPNWNLTEGEELRALYEAITEAVRAVDNNHLLFIEGNWFANDFTGLTPPWDDNMAYSPHKYWSVNDQNSIQWVLSMRDNLNIPLYLGESGENSNVWFRDAIELLESFDIGWAWWPMKKVESIAGPFSWPKSAEYQALLDYWNGTGPEPSAAEAQSALMGLAEGMNIKNLTYQKDVIDAMFRQVNDQTAMPYRIQSIPGILYPTDFDMGPNGVAYFDQEVANYQVTTGNYTSWNNGWVYRNDGVDIETTTDNTYTNGYNIGWIDTDEWMQYSIDVTEPGVYSAEVRIASNSTSGQFHFSIGESPITPVIQTPNTGGWQTWGSVQVDGIVLDETTNKLRFFADAAGFNLGGIKFTRTGATTDVPATLIRASTLSEQSIEVYVSKTLSENSGLSGFSLKINGQETTLSEVLKGGDGDRSIQINIAATVQSTDIVLLSYQGTDVEASDGTFLEAFSDVVVSNSVASVTQIPGRVEAESFFFAQGIQLENTTDAGGGQNIGYLDVGDYADYYVEIPEAGTYRVGYRTAALSETGAVKLEVIPASGAGRQLHQVSFPPTGDWQQWETTWTTATLEAGIQHLRLTIEAPLFNMNWFELNSQTITSADDLLASPTIVVYPNPSNGVVNIQVPSSMQGAGRIEILDTMGRLVKFKEITPDHVDVLEMSLPSGLFILRFWKEDGTIESTKIRVR